MATNNDIKYISFTFEHEEQSDISPYDVEVEITVLEQYKIAEYKFNNTLYDLIPEFNDGFTYTYEDIIEDEVTIRTIYSDSLPIKISFGQGNTEAQPRELSLLGVEYLNITNATKIIYNLFARCQNLQYVNGVNDWDISGISDLTTVFYHCHSLNQLVLSNWDTSNVTNMYCMFRYCQSLTSLDLSNWDTGNVTDMSYTFANCKSLTSLEISNWDTGNVTNMVNMFDICSSLVSLDLSNWDVSKVQNMGAMFGTCSTLKELNLMNWKTDSLTKTDWMFNKCLSLQELDLSNWNTVDITNAVFMFSDCESLETLKLNDWCINENAVIDDIFSSYAYSGCPVLTSIEMQNSDYNSVNKLIEVLPDRNVSNIDLSQIDVMQANEKIWRIAGDANGTLDITGVDDINQVNIADAEAKNWDVIPNVQIEEPIPVEKIIALRPISATEDSGYNNKWTNVVNTYDTSTSTNGTIIVTGSSQSGFKRAYVDTVFNFDNPIPIDAIITKAVLTIRAQQSATTNLYLNVDVNGDSSKRIINNTLLSQSAKDYTVDVADIIKDLNNLKLNLTSAATSNRTFTLYDVRVDVEYTVYETPTYYDVVFVDFDGTILKSDKVLEGESATAPANPSRNGFIFIGWDKTFDIITGDITITALYEEIMSDDDKEFVNAFNIGNEALQQMFIGGDSIVKIYIGDHLIYGYKE